MKTQKIVFFWVDRSPTLASVSYLYVQLYNWYRQLSKEGQKFGYFVNGSKSWLILKSGELAEEAMRVFGEEVNITTEGQRHLGAVIASQEYNQSINQSLY